MDNSLWFPYVSAIARNPAAETLYVWYKGEKVCEIKRAASFGWSMSPYSFKLLPEPLNQPQWPGTYYTRTQAMTALTLAKLTKDKDFLPTDFTMGAEGDARPLDFTFDLAEKELMEAERIFKDVFGGNWKHVGQWMYKTKFPGVPEYRKDRYTGYTRSSKALKITYEMPVVKDVDSETGSEYEVEDENAPRFEDKHVFLADGKLYNIVGYKNTPFDPPADMKLGDVRMMRIPMSVWLLLLRPTEFKDTATVCLAFKKIIVEKAKEFRGWPTVKDLWLMTGDEMVPLHVYNTKVWLENRELSLEEVQALHDRKNDFWMGKHHLIKKLWSASADASSSDV